ncbi:MAG: tRNA lysidine(34) synthetase TilS [Planctomycetes bacterium]|nr:tRNA lysidine(34) synthetase TilS [Planctomycetota bacterium]
MDSFTRLCDATARCLCRYENLVGQRTVLAAISGGVDSTALLLALARLQGEGRLPGPLHVAHVDHAVRPDSRKNAEFVVDRCDRLDVPVSIRRLPAPAGSPSEDDLRQARYAMLQDVAQEVGAGLLLTAHHADDNLETVLFRMLRGTGPRGLAGIPEARWLGRGQQRLLLVRPFLRTRRSTLESILQTLREPVFADSTNTDLRYSRNRLRHETIPQLRQSLGIGLDVALMTVASTARAANEIVEAQGLRILAQCARHKTAWRCELDLSQIDGDSRPFVHEAVRQAHLALHPHGEAASPSWLDRVVLLLDQPDGTRVAGRGGLLAERTRSGLLLLDPDRAGAPPAASDGGQLFLWDGGRQRFGATEWWLSAHEHPLPPLSPSPSEAGRLRALLDPRQCPLPWRLRTRRAGDRFQPLGSSQPLELRRFLQSRHLPRFDRDRVPLLVDANDTILWIPGVEVGERARLQLNTRRCVEVIAHCG